MSDSPNALLPDQPASPVPPNNTALPAGELAGTPTELPSLLSLFEQAAPPRPVPAPDATASARQQAELLVAQLRQQSASAAAPPVVPAPAHGPPAAPVASPGLAPPPTLPPAPPPRPPAALSRPVAAAPRQSSPRGGNGLLLGVLAVAVAVLAALSYVALHRAPAPAAPVVAAVPAYTPPPEALPVPAPVIVRETVRVAVPTPVAPVAADSAAPAASPADSSAAPAPAAVATPDSEPVPAAPEAGDDEATRAVRDKLAAYYADLYEPPLHAAEYFAPQVERLYIQRNLTPDQIDAELARTFFPDNRHAAYQVEPGTLRVSEPAADSSRTATYVEAVRLFRVSRGQHQRLRTQVRARFNAAGQIVYLRQEKLLSSQFER